MNLTRGRPARADMKDLVAIATSLITAVAALFAGAKYVFGFFTPVKLDIELPPIIEFRCSRLNFDPAACMQGTSPDNSHLTITAALFLRALGDPSKEATIKSATATIIPVDRPSEARKLTWLWSGDFVPGQKFERKQVTAHSLKGGEARSQEMWFFPLDEPCGSLSLNDCTHGRRNFVPWLTFVTDVSTTDPGMPRTKAAYEVQFVFDFREGDKSGSKSVSCVVEVSSSLRKMADTGDKRDNGVVYLSAPCRQPGAGVARN